MNNEHITEIIGISLGNNYIYDNNSGDLPLLYVAVGEPHYRGVIGRYRWGIGGLLGALRRRRDTYVRRQSILSPHKEKITSRS